MDSSQNDLPIVLVDDDQQAVILLKSFLLHAGYTNILTFGDGRSALNFLEDNDAAAVVVDLMMPNLPGITLLDRVCKAKPSIPVIVVTAEQEIDTAIECMRLGAVDYLTKPIIVKRFITGIKRALEVHHINEEVDAAMKTPANTAPVALPHVPFIITCNNDMFSLLRYVNIIAHSFQPILITGETGVGKELFAQAIHSLSKRNGAFTSVNVAGLDDTLFSDTLFGHKKGSFTGAVSDRDGLIKKAANGTLFLDEIGDLNELSQIKLLRLLQENEYYPLGSDTPVQNQARLVVATNQSLKQAMLDGKFRKDLYYRLCSHQVNVPPLRSRLDDIPCLLDHFIAESAQTIGREKPSYRKELIDLLCTYDFPGNVRELQAMVIDVITRTTSPKIHVSAFKELICRERGTLSTAPEPIASSSDSNGVHFSRFPTLKEAEDELIRRALEITGNNQGNAAQMLGITRQALNNRLRRGKQQTT